MTENHYETEKFHQIYDHGSHPAFEFGDKSSFKYLSPFEKEIDASRDPKRKSSMENIHAIPSRKDLYILV